MPTPTAADLQAMFGMEPAQAINYLKRKGYAITWDWHEVEAATHARAFTVAKAARLDILQDIRNALVENFRAGKTERDFQRELTPILQAKGWWGKQILVDAKGDAEKVQLGSPRRLKTIYQTNAQSAYMAGRYAEALRAVKTHPYWMYIAINDRRTRPSHRALHGKVYRWDDPIWQYILPPNGYNCRCRFIALSEREVKRRGLKIESSEGMVSVKPVDAGFSKRTGEVSTTNVIVLRTMDAAGKKITFSPDPGFNGSPAQSHLFDEFLLGKAKRALGDEQGLAEVQSTLLSPIRQAAWEAFVDSSLKNQVPQGQTMAFGVMSKTDTDFAQRKGAALQSGVLFLEDRQLTGAKATRHQSAENGLTPDEWKSLPQRISQAERVLWDTKNKTLLYVFPAGDGRDTKIAIRFGRTTVAGNKVEDAATAFKVQRANIDDGINNGMYEVVR
jgi:SPP1 gp7 family putative phage head morphogenesis protein